MESKSNCPFCNKEISKYGMKNHIRMLHTEEGNLKIREQAKNNFKNKDPFDGKRNKNIWIKGKTKETDERVRKISESLIGKGHKCSEETKKKISANKNGKMGGYRKGSGRGKKGLYKGYWCDSSWELAFVIYNLEHDISFKRNTQRFEYEFDRKKLHYIPDFIMEDGTYVEIKNYATEKTDAKHNQFPHNLNVIIGNKGIKPYLDYAIEKYGKDFIKLYEKEKNKMKLLIDENVLQSNGFKKTNTEIGNYSKNSTLTQIDQSFYFDKNFLKSLNQQEKRYLVGKKISVFMGKKINGDFTFNSQIIYKDKMEISEMVESISNKIKEYITENKLEDCFVII